MSAPDRDLVRAYQVLFGNDTGEGPMVLGDLGRICYDEEGPFAKDIRGGLIRPIDPLDMARRNGRMEVFQHIRAMMQLDRSATWRAIENERQRRRAAT